MSSLGDTQTHTGRCPSNPALAVCRDVVCLFTPLRSLLECLFDTVLVYPGSRPAWPLMELLTLHSGSKHSSFLWEAGCQGGPRLHTLCEVALRGPRFAVVLLLALDARACDRTRSWHTDFIPDQQHHWKQRLNLGIWARLPAAYRFFPQPPSNESRKNGVFL